MRRGGPATCVIGKKVLCFFLSRKKTLLFGRKEAKDFCHDGPEFSEGLVFPVGTLLTGILARQ
jgi:hypothetical protein